MSCLSRSPSPSSTARARRTLLIPALAGWSLVVLSVLLAGCDLPTESPSFQVDTRVDAPILTRTTFQVLGTSTDERQALIDTSRESWDTLFTAASGDGDVRLVQEVDAFQFGSLDDLIPDLSVSSASFSFGPGDFAGVGKTDAVTVTAEGTISFDLPHVAFESSDDHVDLDDGRLLIEELTNSFDVDITSLVLTFPDLREAPYEEGDGLTIRFEGSTTDEDAHTYPALEANSTREQVTIDVGGMRLLPTDEEIDYRVEITTEQVPTSDGEISGTLGADQLSVGYIEAVVDPIWVDLTDDADGDGRLELQRDAEAEVTEIGGLADLTDVLSSLSVEGAALDLRLDTNVPVGTDIFAALRGSGGADGAGSSAGTASETVFLEGRGEMAVSSSRADELDLYREAGELGPDRLIRLPVPAATSPTNPTARTVELYVGPETSNADAFLNTLPTELRLVGRALVNPDGSRRMALERPIELTADLEAQLPIAASGEIASFSDRREVDFSDVDALRDTTGGASLRSGTLRIIYTNGLPVEGRITAEVLDANEEPIGVELGTDEDPLVIESAGTEDGLAVAPVSGEASVELSSEELDRLHEGRYVDIDLSLRAGTSNPIRLQGDDEIEIALRGSFELRVDTDS